MAAAAILPSDKLYWGPRLWKFFHLLAEVSDRRDLPLLWQNLLNVSANVIPCGKCRDHFVSYIRTHRFLKFPNLHLVTGAQVKTQIRNELFDFHNAVNERLEKPAFAKEDLAAYGISASQTRADIIKSLYELFDELNIIWKPLLYTSIAPANFNLWKTHVALMLRLVNAGAY